MRLANDPGWTLEAEGKRARLDIYDAIGDWGEECGVSAKLVSEALDGLGEGVKDIDVHINSPGGSAFDGITIYNRLSQHKARVVVHIDGLAASAATVVAMAGDEIRIAENAMMMIHQASGVTMGTAEDHQKQIGALATLDKQILRTYVARTGGDEDDIRQQMAEETWFSADEAIEAGFADVLVEAKKAAASFDPAILAHFRNTPDEIKQHFSNKRSRTMAKRTRKTAKAQDEERKAQEEEERRNQDEEERRNQNEEEERNEEDEERRNEDEEEMRAQDDEEEERTNQDPPKRREENKAASLRQLKNALPDADSDFLIECMDKGRSVNASLRAYTLKLQDRLKNMEASQKRPGVPALGGSRSAKGGEATATADPVEQWTNKVEELTSKGMAKHEATLKVAHANPELRQAYVEAYNSQLG